MAVSLAAYVYASITTEEHEFDSGMALVLFFADLLIAGAFIPNVSIS